MVLAHEVGHQLQFTYNLPSIKETTARAMELEADGLAGYYLRRGYGKSTFYSIATGYEFAASIGDNCTNCSDHHGLSCQRKSAVRLGFLLADLGNPKLTAKQFDYNFNYYYSGVLSGSYRMGKPDNVDQNTHDLIMQHMEELRKIQSGDISDKEYFGLE